VLREMDIAAQSYIWADDLALAYDALAVYEYFDADANGKLAHMRGIYRRLESLPNEPPAGALARRKTDRRGDGEGGA